MSDLNIRRAAVAGSWYPGNPSALREMIQGYLDQVDTVLSGVQIRAVIAPHAGYVYSGRCAAHSFKQLEGQKVGRVFLMGPSHYTSFHGVSIPNVDAYETPLGIVKLDAGAVAELRMSPLVTTVPQAHTREHALELELPFLPTVVTDFTLVPMIISQLTPNEATGFGELIGSIMEPDDVVVVSCDFTHYGAAFGYTPFRRNVREQLTQLDMGAVDRVLARDTAGIFTYANETGITWDGVNVVPVMLGALPADAQGKLLCYYKSGDEENDYAHSVSYVSLAFYTPEKPGARDKPDKPDTAVKPDKSDKSDNPKKPDTAGQLTAEEHEALLSLARQSLECHVKGEKLPDPRKFAVTPRLEEKAGAFVTLHEHGQLRGCIGYIEGIKPLVEAVQENACNAATRDPRFPAVTAKELPDIDLEISVMSPLRKIDSPEEVIAGTHGVVLKKGWAQGVFLPQVATEQGWDRETFLRHLGLKAGLDMDAYKSADLYVFTADVFGQPH